MKHTHTLVAVLGLVAPACTSSLVVKRPDSVPANQAVTEAWARDIRRVARDGDWILTRSYSLIGDTIVYATFGDDISHSSLYDASRGTVIEAITPVVREVPLEQLLDRNRYAIVVRPRGQGEAAGRAAVARARSVLGASYDYLGMIGLGDDARFYCSELLLWAAGMRARGHHKILITPADLMRYGDVIYFSGYRNDPAMQRAAVESKQRAGRASRASYRSIQTSSEAPMPN